MSTKTMKNAMALGATGALGVACAVAIATASPSWAAPVLYTAAVRTAASNQVTEVRYYGRGHYGRGYGRGFYGRGYGRGYYGGGYGRGFYGGGYGYPYGGYAYPYYPYANPYGYGWGGW